MTALARSRAVDEKKISYLQYTLASGLKAWQGGAAGLTPSTGKVGPMTSATGLIFLGFFAESVDATSGDLPVNINLIDEFTIIWWVNGTSTDAVAATDVGRDCYFLDDQTVSILPTGKSLAGRIEYFDATRGVGVRKVTRSESLAANPSLPAQVGNDIIPTTITNDAIYDIPTTAAASTVTLPAAAADGTKAFFTADGTKNGHTVTYRDATGPTSLTTALTASKRHLVIVSKLGGKWFANAYVSP